MKTFIKQYKTSTIKNKDGKKVMIYKFIKEGTKRVFFSLESEDGKRLTSTMFARLYDARKLASRYLAS